MKNKLLKSIGLISIVVLSLSITSFNPSNVTTTYVYVCGKSKIYHKSKSHSALDRCKSGITKITQTKAKSLGKRECKCRDK